MLKAIAFLIFAKKENIKEASSSGMDMLEKINNSPSNKKAPTISSSARKMASISPFRDLKTGRRFTPHQKLGRLTNSSELMRVHRDQRTMWFIHIAVRCLMWQKRAKKMVPLLFNGIITGEKTNYSTCATLKTSHLHHQSWIDPGKKHSLLIRKFKNRII